MITEQEILERLKKVEDPEIGMNVVDLGLVYELDLDEEGRKLHVNLTLTSPGCPYGPELIRQIQRELRAFDPTLDVQVDLVWQPLWHPSMMSEYARDELGYDEELGMTYGY